MDYENLPAVVRGLMGGITPEGTRMRRDLMARNARLRAADRRLRRELWGHDDVVARLEAGRGTPLPPGDQELDILAW